MTVRIWGRVVLTAVGAGALIGAGQLGVAYGLGIVDLARSFGSDTNQWNAQLAWVGWLAMLAAVGGAAVGQRIARRQRFAPGVGTRILLALFAGVGAGAVIPLSAQQARSAHLAQSVDPALVVGLTAAVGAVAGVLVAVVALSLRPLAWNLAAMAVAVWLVGLAGVRPNLDPDDATASTRLGVPKWTIRVGETDRLVEMLAMPVLALLAGLVVAAVARGRRQPGLGTAISGMAGPAALALAYLIAGPGVNGDKADQMAPYLGALIAIPAGLLGSLLVTTLRRRDPAKDAATADHGTRPGDPVEPTNILPALTKKGQRRPTAPAPSPIPPQRTPAQASAQRASASAPAQRASASAPARASASAAVPRRDDHADWVAGLSGGAQDGSLPRRDPG